MAKYDKKFICEEPNPPMTPSFIIYLFVCLLSKKEITMHQLLMCIPCELLWRLILMRIFPKTWEDFPQSLHHFPLFRTISTRSPYTPPFPITYSHPSPTLSALTTLIFASLSYLHIPSYPIPTHPPPSPRPPSSPIGWPAVSIIQPLRLSHTRQYGE